MVSLNRKSKIHNLKSGVSPPGIEPGSTASETATLSIELWRHVKSVRVCDFAISGRMCQILLALSDVKVPLFFVIEGKGVPCGVVVYVGESGRSEELNDLGRLIHLLT